MLDRSLYDAEVDKDTAEKLINQAKNLILSKRREWTSNKDKKGKHSFNCWIDELLFICHKLYPYYAKDTRNITNNSSFGSFISILTFATTYIDQNNFVSEKLKQISHCIECMNVIIPFYISVNNADAVVLMLQAYSHLINDSTLLSACLYLVNFNDYIHLVKKYIEHLETKYPIQMSCLRAYMLICNIHHSEIKDKGSEALSIIVSALEEYPDDYMLNYNTGYLLLKLHRRDEAVEFIKRSLKSKPTESQTYLVLIRILRYSKNFKQALELYELSRTRLEYWDKFLTLEALYIASESDNYDLAQSLFKRIKKFWINDDFIIASIIRLNLVYGNVKEAEENFKQLSAISSQTPEFHFCYAQLCMIYQDYYKAETSLLHAIQGESSCGDYHASLAAVLDALGKKNSAINRAKFGTEIDPENIHTWIMLAKIMGTDVSKDIIDHIIDIRYNTIDMTNIRFMFRADNLSASPMLH